MKRQIITTLIAVMLIFLLSSCGKERKQNDDTDAVASPSAATTEAPQPTSTPTPSPTPALPDRPDRLTPENVTLAMDEQIDSFEYAYRGIVTLASPEHDDRYFGDVAVLQPEPASSRSLNIAEFSTDAYYNREIRYFDADFKLLKTRLLFNDKEVLSEYNTEYGLVFDRDGERFYSIGIRETDAEGRLVYVSYNLHEYTYYDYGEEGRLAGKYTYTDGEITQYTLYTYDTEGRLLTVNMYRRLEENDPAPIEYSSTERTYDNSGNIYTIAECMYTGNVTTYSYTYRKDALGRLSERTVTLTYSDGSQDSYTCGIKYYSNGPILVYEQSYSEDNAFIVFLPDEETKTKFYTCSGITAEETYAFSRYDSYDPHDSTELCSTARIEYADSGLERYLHLPKSLIPDDRSVRLVSSRSPIEKYPRLMAADVYDDSLFPHDELLAEEMFASYSAGDRLRLTYYYDRREENTILAAWDTNGRLLYTSEGLSINYAYDNEDRIVGWSGSRKDDYDRGTVFYDDNGKLTFLESNYSMSAFNYHMTCAIIEYHGDGRD